MRKAYRQLEVTQMNGKDFIEAVKDHKVLCNKNGIVAKKNEDAERYYLYTADYSVFVAGNEIQPSMANNDFAVLYLLDGRQIAVVETDDFEVVE